MEDRARRKSERRRARERGGKYFVQRSATKLGFPPSYSSASACVLLCPPTAGAVWAMRHAEDGRDRPTGIFRRQAGSGERNATATWPSRRLLDRGGDTSHASNPNQHRGYVPACMCSTRCRKAEMEKDKIARLDPDNIRNWPPSLRPTSAALASATKA